MRAIVFEAVRRRQLVSRPAVGHTKGVRVVTITGTDEALLHAARRDRTAGLATALAHLDPADAAALLAALPALESLADQLDWMPPDAARSA